MADLVIRGLHLPKSLGGEETRLDIRLFSDGTVIMATSRPPYYKKFDAVPLPEGHGRLGDLEIAEAILHNKAFDLAGTSGEYNALRWALRQIKALPTIVPSEGGGEDG